MQHGYFGLLWLAWGAVMAGRFVPEIWARRRAALRERLASDWPGVPGRIRGSSIKFLSMRWRLELTYDSFESGRGIDLWRHDFLSKLEAEHAGRVLADRPCVVHYNPRDEQQTTLLFSDIRAMLARDPYVPQLVRLSRAGYRWLFGLAMVAAAAFLASLTLYGVAMAGSTICVCDAMLYLLIGSPFVLLAALVPMRRMLTAASCESLPARIKFLLSPAQRWMLAAVFLGSFASVAHFGPALRALDMDADIPNKVFAGAVGVLPIPIYLFATIIAIEGLKRLRPAPVSAEVAATV